jgi:hypothetical protein
MTRIDEVIEQIEAVINDDECPATLGELVEIKRVLVEITRQCAQREEPVSHPEAAVAAGRFFPGVVYDYLRDYERRRPAPGLVRPAAMVSCSSL